MRELSDLHQCGNVLLPIGAVNRDGPAKWITKSVQLFGLEKPGNIALLQHGHFSVQLDFQNGKVDVPQPSNDLRRVTLFLLLDLLGSSSPMVPS